VIIIIYAKTVSTAKFNFPQI